MEVFKDKSQKKGIIKRFLSNFTSQKKLKQTKSINESFVLVETTKKELLQVQEEDYLDDQLDTNEMFNYSANIETNINEEVH